MKVSIIIPYNRDRGWLKEAIKSVETQGYPDIQLILSQSDQGVSHNLNVGIEQTEGELIRYLCEDDLLPPDSIAQTVEMFDTENYDFIHANAIYFGRGSLNWKPPVNEPTLKQMLTLNRISGGTVVYHKRCFSDFDDGSTGNRFDEELWTGEEYDFNMKLLAQGFRIGYLPFVNYLYRLHKDQKSIGNKGKLYQGKRQKVINQIKKRYANNTIRN